LAIPFLLANHSRPLVGRQNILVSPRPAQYFHDMPSLREPYREAAKYLHAQHCHTVGWIGSGNDREYPFWVLFTRFDVRQFQVWPVEVSNVSVRLPAPVQRVDALVLHGQEAVPEQKCWNGTSYRRTWVRADMAVFLRDTETADRR
jgi:hypothetical protein